MVVVKRASVKEVKELVRKIEKIVDGCIKKGKNLKETERKISDFINKKTYDFIPDDFLAQKAFVDYAKAYFKYRAYGRPKPHFSPDMYEIRPVLTTRKQAEKWAAQHPDITGSPPAQKVLKAIKELKEETKAAGKRVGRGAVEAGRLVPEGTKTYGGMYVKGAKKVAGVTVRAGKKVVRKVLNQAAKNAYYNKLYNEALKEINNELDIEVKVRKDIIYKKTIPHTHYLRDNVRAILRNKIENVWYANGEITEDFKNQMISNIDKIIAAAWRDAVFPRRLKERGARYAGRRFLERTWGGKKMGKLAAYGGAGLDMVTWQNVRGAGGAVKGAGKAAGRGVLRGIGALTPQEAKIEAAIEEGKQIIKRDSKIRKYKEEYKRIIEQLKRFEKERTTDEYKRLEERFEKWVPEERANLESALEKKADSISIKLATKRGIYDKEIMENIAMGIKGEIPDIIDSVFRSRLTRIREAPSSIRGALDTLVDAVYELLFGPFTLGLILVFIMGIFTWINLDMEGQAVLWFVLLIVAAFVGAWFGSIEEAS